MIFDVRVKHRKTCGWLYKLFILFRAVRQNVQFADFDFSEQVSNLLSLTKNTQAFLFHLNSILQACAINDFVCVYTCRMDSRITSYIHIMFLKSKPQLSDFKNSFSDKMDLGIAQTAEIHQHQWPACALDSDVLDFGCQ